MNKRLLLSLAVGCASLSSFAYNTGDYIFTTDAKYKVVGENLVANGQFANNYASWTTLEGNAVSTDFWSVESGAGANGENVLQSVSTADGNAGAYVGQSVAVDAGKTYVVSMKVYAPASMTTSVTTGAANYLDAFFTEDFSFSKTATGFAQVASTTGIPSNEWTDVSFSYTAQTAGAIAVAFGRMTEGTQVTGFEVHEVQQVYDTRILERKIAYDKKLLALDEFPEGKDELAGIVEALDALVTTGEDSYGLGINLDDVQSVTDFVSQLSELEASYMNANSYDLVAGGKISGGALWTTKVQKADGNYGDWFVGGTGRWFHQPADADYINDAFPGNYALGAGYAGIHKTLPAGKYFFQIDAQGYAFYKNKVNGSFYTINYDQPVTNRLFAGTDTLAAETLDARNYQTYFIIHDFAEPVDANDLNVVMGVIHEAMDNGGQFNYKNPVLRLISPTAEADINKFISDAAKDVQLNAAKVMIDSASVVLPKVEYPWGKPALQAAIDANTADYNTLAATPSTEMLNSASGDGSTVSVPDSLTEVMRNMRGSIQEYYAENEPYTSLVAAVADAQTVYADAQYAGASASAKTALKAAIDKANACIAAFKAQNDSVEGDAVKSAALVAELSSTKVAFTSSVASYDKPAEIDLVNPFFAEYKAWNSVNGWDTSGSQSDNGRWKSVTGAHGFENQTALNMQRGYTAYSKNKAVQKVTLTTAGIYEFSCQATAYNERGSYDGDRNQYSGIFYFVKNEASADSIGAIMVHTDRANMCDNTTDANSWGNGFPEYFTVVYKKTSDTPETIELGFDALQNVQCNTYRFGGNHVRYMGDADKYAAALKANIESQLPGAKATLAAITDSTTTDVVSDGLNYKQVYNTLKYAVAQAEAALAQTGDAALNAQSKAAYDVAKAVEVAKVVTTGIAGVVTTETVPTAAQGVYNIAGQKVADSMEGLAKGLYIVNGKKVIVK